MSMQIFTKDKPIIGVLIISIASILLGWIIDGYKLAIFICLTNLSVIYLTRSIWLSNKNNYLIRVFLLTIVSGVVLIGNTWWQPLINPVIKSLFPKIEIPDYSISAGMYFFLLALVTIGFYLTRDTTILGKSEVPINKYIQEPDFLERMKMVSLALADDLRDIDRRSNWSVQYFTPLEAEVEVQTQNGKKKLVTDLMTALKKTDDRLILIIGDPGSGKSVSLRKLCLELSDPKEVVRSEKIPIYVNLREWKDDHGWTEQSPPSVEDLKGFILNSLKNSNYTAASGGHEIKKVIAIRPKSVFFGHQIRFHY